MDNILSDNIEKQEKIIDIKGEREDNLSDNTLSYIIDGQALVDNIIDIKYIGKLVENDNNDKKIFIHYGYGLLWENPNQLELAKGENNTYYTSIRLDNFDSISFGFRDNLDNWDICETGSYHISILKENISITKIDNELPFIPDDTGLWEKILENIKRFFWSFFKRISKAKS